MQLVNYPQIIGVILKGYTNFPFGGIVILDYP